jgi:hypothetical protein
MPHAQINGTEIFYRSVGTGWPCFGTILAHARPKTVTVRVTNVAILLRGMEAALLSAARKHHTARRSPSGAALFYASGSQTDSKTTCRSNCLRAAFSIDCRNA